MPITRTATGTTYEGPRATSIFRYQTFIIGLQMEARVPGLKMTRGPSMLSRSKKITGLRTNKREEHIRWFERAIENLSALDAMDDLS